MDSIPINLMTSTKHSFELNCAFGMVMANLLIHTMNLGISSPKPDIALNANNVKSCL